MSAARWGLPGRAAASPSPAGATPRGTCSPLPSPILCSTRAGSCVWEKRPSGEEPANLDPLTSRATPGPGQGGSAEKRRSGGLAAPPRRFREKVSSGATSSASRVLTRLGGPALTLKPSEGVLTPARQVHYFKIGRKMPFFFYFFKNVMVSGQGLWNQSFVRA